jgi:hypothetical protein
VLIVKRMPEIGLFRLLKGATYCGITLQILIIADELGKIENERSSRENERSKAWLI